MGDDCSDHADGNKGVIVPEQDSEKSSDFLGQ